MSTIKTSGLVLRSIKFRETSMIVDIYTEQRGLRSYIVNGVRKSKAKLSASIFQHGNLIEMVAYDGDGSKLLRIKDISLKQPYKNLPFNVEKSSIALFILEVIKNSIREQEPNPELFNFLSDYFHFIDDYEGKHTLIHIKFLCDYARYIGFEPRNNWSEQEPYFNLELGHFTSDNHGLHLMRIDVGKAFSELLSIDRNNLHSLNFLKEIRAELIENLILFYKLHIDTFNDLKSYDILKKVF